MTHIESARELLPIYDGWVVFHQVTGIKTMGGFVNGGTAKMRTQRSGLTLIEAVIAMAILATATLGALAYAFHGAKQIRIAHAELAAARTGQLLLEDWKSTGGALNYDPTVIGMGFLAVIGTPGDYVNTVDGTKLYTTLSPRTEVGRDDFTGDRLYRITVTLRWRGDFSAAAPGAGDPSAMFTTYVKQSTN
jgi:type II secretory pathway pseudopilin PulG